MEKKASAEKAVREIRRKTRRRFSAEELSFDRDGRFYISREGGSVKVLRVGDKKSQPADIRWIRDNYSSRP